MSLVKIQQSPCGRFDAWRVSALPIQAGTLEQDERTVGTRPAQCAQPAGQAKTGNGVGEFAVAEQCPDFSGMHPVLTAFPVFMEARQRVLNGKLTAQGLQNNQRGIARIIHESSQESHRGELQCKTQPVMGTSPDPVQRPVVVAQMEKSRQIVLRRRRGIAAIVLPLRGGKEINGHFGIACRL